MAMVATQSLTQAAHQLLAEVVAEVAVTKRPTALLVALAVEARMVEARSGKVDHLHSLQPPPVVPRTGGSAPRSAPTTWGAVVAEQEALLLAAVRVQAA